MHGFDFSDQSLTGTPSLLQADVITRVTGLVERAGDLGELQHSFTPEAALKSLLHGRSDYHEPACPIALAPFDLDLISLPATLKGAPRAEDLLPEDDCRFLKEQERMFRPEHESFEFFKPYWDPALKHCPRKYRSFIKKLDSIDYLRYTLNPVEMAGVFFVKKSDGKRIRMIIDGRGANQRLRDPPSVSLSTAETFSRIEVSIPEELIHDEVGKRQFLSSTTVFAGLSDVKDCFHRIRQPDWMCRLFCLLPIEARHVGLTGHTLDGVVLQSNDLVYPMPGSLAMGCSWSLYLAQKINEHQFRLSPGLSASEIVHDRSHPLIIDPDDPNKTNHYVYVDNLGIIGQSKEGVTSALSSMEDHFNSKQLLLHPGEVHSDSVKALGIQLNGSSKTTRITPDRLHKVRAGLRGLISRGRCSGKVLEILVGHATFCGLSCRLVLSVFHATYKFIEKNYDKVTPLWGSVRDELRAFAGLMVFFESDWTRGWNSLVTSSDASEKGYGVCTSHWHPSQVAAAGRRPERSRFRRTESHRARESALTAAGFFQDSATGRWLAGEIDSEQYLTDVGWQCSPDFKEIDGQLLHKHLWTPKLWGTWKHEEHILVLEARALNKALDRVACSRFGKNIRQLMLVDSMSVALSFDRCRSRSFKLLKQVRRYAATCLARNIDPHVRWIPSELNSADEPSRIDAAEPSKTLVDQIPIKKDVQTTQKVEGPRPTGTSLILRSQEASIPSTGFSEREALGEKSSANSGANITDRETPDKTDIHLTGGSRIGQVRSAKEKSESSEPCQLRQLKFINLACEQEAREEFDFEKQAPMEEVCGRSNGVGQSRPLTVREKGYREGGISILPDGVCRVPSLCPQQCSQPSYSSTSGHGHDQVHEPSLPSGPPFAQRGQALSGLHAPSSRFQPIWIKPAASCLSSTERSEEVSARQLTEGLSSRSLGCHCSGIGSSRSGEDGSFHYDVPLSLHSAKRTFSLQDHVLGPAHITGDRALVASSQPGGVPDQVQNRRVRRQHPVRLSLFEALGLGTLQRTETAAGPSAAMGLQLSELLPGFHTGRKEASDRCHPVQHETFGSIHRPKQKHSSFAGSPKKRKVEKSQECGSLRKIGQVSGHIQSAPHSGPKTLPARRDTSRGCDAGTYQTPSASLKRGNRPGKYIADLFAGKGGVAHQCRRLGYKAKEWELERGIQYDLTSRKVRRRLISDIKRGRVLGAMLAPPCTTFSIARNRTKVIRSRDYPWGLPGSCLTEVERQKVEEGNRCFEAAFQIIYHLNKHHIPWLLENPQSSMCWHLPPIRDLIDKHGCCLITLDFCQFGTRWKKPTSILAGQLDMQDLGRLQLRCRGADGTCSRTLKKHWQLTGTYKGVNLTKLAQPYPTTLCKQLAWALTSPSHYNHL